MYYVSSENNDNRNFLFFIFTKNIIDSHKSIRWVGIIDQNGIIINQQFRVGLKHFLTKEENQEYVTNTRNRHKTRSKFEPKIGNLTYSFGRYQNSTRFIVPINEIIILLTMDFEENNFDKIIMDKIISLVKEEKNKL